MANTHGGGALTTAHGLKFEQDTRLADAFIKNGDTITKKNEVVRNGVVIGMLAPKGKLYSKFLEPRGVDWTRRISRKMLPDEVFINHDAKIVFIIEKKFQKQTGSVDEKLQTCEFKKQQYTKLIKPTGYTVEYLYVCNDFFKNPVYRDMMAYIEKKKCHIFFNEVPLTFLFPDKK